MVPGENDAALPTRDRAILLLRSVHNSLIKRFILILFFSERLNTQSSHDMFIEMFVILQFVCFKCYDI